MQVYKAINAVQAALAARGITKGSENKFDGYKFRGIDEVYNAVAPLLAQHGLLILPRMLTRTVDERQSQKGGALFYVTVEAEFDFVSAEDGTKHVVKTFGEAMDRGDKATNKAMSAAYKYACVQAFCIPTEGDNDADSISHDVAAKPARAKGAIKPTDGANDRVPSSARKELDGIALDVIEAAEAGESDHAAALCGDVTDADEKVYLWSKLPSHVRTAIKKVSQQTKGAE